MEAYHRIKQMIVTLQLPPGAVIIEADLQAGDLDSGLYVGNSLRGLVKAELA